MEHLDSTDLRIIHTQTVIDIIRRLKNTSRREIQSLSHLSWGTVSNIIAALLSNQIVEEFDSPNGNPGRTPKLLRITYKKHLTLGLDINISGMTCVVCDFANTLLYSQSSEILGDDRDFVLTLMHQAIKTALARFPNVAALALSMQGLVDSLQGMSVSCPHIKNWRNVPLKSICETEYHLQTMVFHDPDCLLAYEIFCGQTITQNTRNALVIKLDKGIGMAQMIEKQRYIGSTFKANELGHTITDDTALTSVSFKRRDLESYCSSTGIIERYREITGTKYITLQQIYNLAKSGDRAAAEVFEDTGTKLGIALYNLIVLLEPEAIIIGGLLSCYKDAFYHKIEEVVDGLQQTDGYSTKIIFAKFSDTAPALGAVIQANSRLTKPIIAKIYNRPIMPEGRNL